MKQLNKNEKINNDVEAKEILRLIGLINERINVCPRSVLCGSHNLAVSWKSAAKEAMSAAASKAPKLKKLQDCFSRLDLFYSGEQLSGQDLR